MDDVSALLPMVCNFAYSHNDNGNHLANARRTVAKITS
jgi:hypothetical protein